MLAGRKLLLADDSVTIQKVIDLTFADEGVEVVAVGNGQEAIDKVADLKPDIVLADVFMPGMNGYQVCEHIKRHSNLKHIPVMLLVGSFEPFDEAEARRVGADDILTKPFQSIRRLIDKVGGLVTKTPEAELPTAELPRSEPEPEEPKLSTAELEIVTADTLRMPPGGINVISPEMTSTAVSDIETQTPVTPMESTAPESPDSLLDLGDFEVQEMPAGGDESILDIDLPEPAPLSAAVSYAPASFGSWQATTFTRAPEDQEFRGSNGPSGVAFGDSGYETEPLSERAAFHPSAREEGVTESGHAPRPAAGELSPEMIDAIARRAVEQLSEKVVQEIAWEVVPQLAELLIKRRLEQQESHTK